jgi:hypothetical protein
MGYKVAIRWPVTKTAYCACDAALTTLKETHRHPRV